LLANAYDQQGDRSAAEGLLRRAQAGFERTLGLTHPKSLASLYTLFENLSEGPEPAAAEAWGEKLVSTSQQVHGPSHPLTDSAVWLVADLYRRRQNFAAAIALVRRALAALPSKQTPLTVEQAKLQSLLAVLLDLAGQTDEAETLVRSAAYALYAHLGPNHTDTDGLFRHVTDLAIRRNLRTPFGRFRLRCLRILGKVLQGAKIMATKRSNHALSDE
jgi:tetratricopeptide (TPR) repeat protein